MHRETLETYLAIVRCAAKDVLRVHGVALDKSLTELGGTSLDAIELIMALEERLEVELPDDFLSAESTIRSIAIQVAERLSPPKVDHRHHA